MDDLNKDERIHNSKVDKENQQQQRPESSTHSKSESLETSNKIRTSAWITLGILGSTILITMYGETMLLPAIRDIIRDFDISIVHRLGYSQHILSQGLLLLPLPESYLISTDGRRW